jgi:1-acyl-sn-glycerol-3-phosphate acyltransferase
MSSTRSSNASSAIDQVDRYQGLDYRRALAAPLDPLLHPDPSRPTRLYRVVLTLAWYIARLLFRYRVDGVENVPRSPFIIASNHQAWFDTLFILAALRAHRAGRARLPMIYTMARQDTVFNRRWKRWLLPRVGVFPIMPRQGELDERGVRCVYQVLARGGVVLIFPEGRYSRGRQLRPLKKGVAHFSLQAGVPICPVAISGLDRLRPFGEVRVSIGRPVWPTPPRWWDFNRRVQRLLGSVRRAILRAFEGRARERRLGRLRRLLARVPRVRLPRRRGRMQIL